jgi:hypothetical protein
MKAFVKDLSGFLLNDVKEEKQNARYRSNSENQLIFPRVIQQET